MGSGLPGCRPPAVGSNAGIAGQMPLGMLARPIAHLPVREQRRRIDRDGHALVDVVALGEGRVVEHVRRLGVGRPVDRGKGIARVLQARRRRLNSNRAA